MRAITTIFLIGSVFLACSNDPGNPGSSQPLNAGRILIYNESTVSIRLTDFTQKRGDLEHNSVLNITVYTMQGKQLRNMLDGGQSYLFPGGDRVWVKFRSVANDPNNPDLPLFENTASLVINGNNTILVKTGGEFDLGSE